MANICQSTNDERVKKLIALLEEAAQRGSFETTVPAPAGYGFSNQYFKDMTAIQVAVHTVNPFLVVIMGGGFTIMQSDVSDVISVKIDHDGCVWKTSCTVNMFCVEDILNAFEKDIKTVREKANEYVTAFLSVHRGDHKSYQVKVYVNSLENIMVEISAAYGEDFEPLAFPHTIDSLNAMSAQMDYSQFIEQVCC